MTRLTSLRESVPRDEERACDKYRRVRPRHDPDDERKRKVADGFSAEEVDGHEREERGDGRVERPEIRLLQGRAHDVFKIAAHAVQVFAHTGQDDDCSVDRVPHDCEDGGDEWRSDFNVEVFPQNGEEPDRNDHVVERCEHGDEAVLPALDRSRHFPEGIGDICEDGSEDDQKRFPTLVAQFGADRRTDRVVAQFLGLSERFLDGREEVPVAFLIERFCADVHLVVADRLDDDGTEIERSHRPFDFERRGTFLKTQRHERSAGEINPLFQSERGHRKDGRDDQRAGEGVPDGAELDDVHTFFFKNTHGAFSTNVGIATSFNSVFVTTIAVNMLITTPIASVSANPLMIEDENPYSTAQEISVVAFPYRMDVQARLNASSIACEVVFPSRNSSLRRSKMRTFASTAMPSDKMNPAMPESVMVTGMSLKSASSNAA